MVPIAPVVTDADVTPDPLLFDGLRNYRDRKRPDQATRHQFATTSATNLHFGHGKFACPGRFLAGNSIKMLLSNLLLRYDVGFVGGGTDRPANVHLHEYVFPNPYACVEFRPRKSQEFEFADKM